MILRLIIENKKDLKLITIFPQGGFRERLEGYEVRTHAGSRLKKVPCMQVEILHFTLSALGNHCRILNKEEVRSNISF